MADRVICMMLGSPLTEYSVHLFKQSIQSCTLPSARKPVYRALCIVSLKHSAEYSVWSIQSAYYHLAKLELRGNFDHKYCFWANSLELILIIFNFDVSPISDCLSVCYCTVLC